MVDCSRGTWYHLNCVFFTPIFASATRLTARTFSSAVKNRASTGESGKRNHRAIATSKDRPDQGHREVQCGSGRTKNTHPAEDEEDILPKVNLRVLDVPDL